MRHARGAIVPALAGALAVVLALTIGASSDHPGSGGEPVAATSSASATTATSSPTAQADPGRGDALRFSLAEPSQGWREGSYVPDLAAVQQLLDRRGRAAVAGDVRPGRLRPARHAALPPRRLRPRDGDHRARRHRRLPGR